MSESYESIMAKVAAEKARRAELMPTEQAAIRVMNQAWLRLKELGWREGRAMPTTGVRHAGIQCGSTGIHAYTAERREPSRTMYMIHDGDLWPTSLPPVLFRPWKETDLQAERRICAPIPDESQPTVKVGPSLLRKPLKPGERLVCYCPPGICQAPKGFSGPCNRASESAVTPRKGGEDSRE